ncbi:restriction endonuclease subunit S [Francisella tularensis]|uniref:restriction endonuclease subunit S n=1 Tax=Francisella tularensis TaxID=263 RepID=UPI0008F4B40E|nr:restriction endonuclease subunit S [Francisella tularensis]APA82773.1 Type I restriction-modification system, specificity subunit S [Francisella tularensis subsp. novicida PA10-7858]
MNKDAESIKVPKLRFKEFSEEWVEKKLGDTSTIVGGGTPDTTNDELWNGNIQWFTPTEIKSKYVHNSIRTISELGLKKSSAKLLPKGTLLLSSRATVGDIGIAVNKCATNQGFQSLIVKKQNDNIFLYNWIIKNKKEFIKRASGSTFLEISKKEIEKIKINLPTLPEQQKIADCLSTWDEAIETQKSLIENKKLYKKGMMQKLFNGKLKVENGKCVFEQPSLRFKPSQAEIEQAIENGKLKNENGTWIASEDSPIIFNSQLSTFNYRDWVEKKLGDVLKYEQPTKYIVQSTEYSNDYDVPVLTAGKSFILGYTNEKKGIYKDTPVIIFDDFTTSNNFVNFEFKVKSSAMKILRNKNDSINIKFVYEAMQMLHFPIGEHKRYWISEYSYLKINLPCLEEQTKIANFLSALDDEIELLEQELEQLQLQKKGLMQGMFV